MTSDVTLLFLICTALNAVWKAGFIVLGLSPLLTQKQSGSNLWLAGAFSAPGTVPGIHKVLNKHLKILISKARDIHTDDRVVYFFFSMKSPELIGEGIST